MKCDRCEQEATVHELRVVGGQKVEKHLCESCAREEGIQAQGPGSVGELVGQLMMAAAGPSVSAGESKGVVCPSCKTTFAEFRQSGLMGCAACYSAFERPLSGLLERAHEGGLQHIGKVPRRQAVRGVVAAGGASPAQGKRTTPPGESASDGPPDRAQMISQLRKQLEQALKHEQYERAAKVRDELRRLEQTGGSRKTEPPPPGS